MTEMTARYNGTCRYCEGKISAGDQIVYTEGNTYHPACWKEESEWKATGEEFGRSLIGKRVKVYTLNHMKGFENHKPHEGVVTDSRFTAISGRLWLTLSTDDGEKNAQAYRRSSVKEV
ncbi:MAG: hypothetical protein PHT33_03935 [bacterium]|nr:hypothetical protein [bacterium]